MASKDLLEAVESYENYIKANANDLNKVFEAISNYTDAVETAMYIEQDVDYALMISKRVKEYIDLFLKSLAKDTKYDIWQLEKACRESEQEHPALEKYYRCLRAEAPYYFDSYLLYLEKNRELKDRFYLPRRKCFLKIGIIQDLQDLEDDKLDLLSISMPPSSGKAQPLYSKVLTPNGFVKMGDIKVGDKVMSANGNVCDVLGVFPQGKRPIYELTLNDGAKCRCSDEHLWKVKSRDDRRRGNDYRIFMLKDMLKNFRVECGRRSNYSIECVGKIDFKHKDFAIHPYIMGVLLGDGNIKCTPEISSEDWQVLVTVQSFLPNGYDLCFKDRCTYKIKGHEGNNTKAGSLFSNELKKYGLFGHGSLDKFIPEDYMLGDYEQRLWLLRGLLDTDGSVGRNGGVSFCSISSELAHGVVELVRSLGGTASIIKTPSGYKKDGKYIKCNDAYNVYIKLPDCKDGFVLERKKGRCKPNRYNHRFIENIEYVGEEECQCIYISDPSHLYVTDDYIVTHNTTLEKFFLSWVVGNHYDDFNLFFSHSGDITRMFYEGMLDITTNADEYTWHDIFPMVALQGTNAKTEAINFGKYKPFKSIQCTSVGSKNAGKVRANHLLMCDDMIGGIEEALNKNILDKLWNVYAVDARQRKTDGCKELHIATRWSVHDVIGRLKNIYDGNDRAKFLAIPDIDPITGESNFAFDINGFSVEFYNNQALLMDDISYRCLYKNEPIEREGLLYHEDELRRYLDLPLGEPDAILAVCDTKNKGTDFLVMPCVYVYGDDHYCVDCICTDSSDYGVQYGRMANLILDNKVQQCEFESNNGGDRVAFEVDELVKKADARCNITTKPTSTNKETRIIVNADWVKKHVLFKDKSQYTPKSDYGVMMNWLLSYTVSRKNVHDDVPDAWANYALYVTQGLCRTVVEVVSRFF